jgi:hypothetical protein
LNCAFGAWTLEASGGRLGEIEEIDLEENSAGGGARTHTILRSLDFESSASASSATPAGEGYRFALGVRGASEIAAPLRWAKRCSVRCLSETILR